MIHPPSTSTCTSSNLEVLVRRFDRCRCVRPQGRYYSAASHEHRAVSRKARNEQPPRSASSLGRARQKEKSKARNLSARRDLSGGIVGMQAQPQTLSASPFSLRRALLLEGLLVQPTAFLAHRVVNRYPAEDLP